ncbi:hypothetical protein JVT61DRAFT_4079 [Boletus reticuloceps]|uniref:Uncharacterized protein n=1 Tax=Boletus reticuloceps TaxID=495285 RepID=A0A8I2YL54_9AGAM|nr:hypothetical protein JVT61DRAFT_4079 [Boletus reticuloceps]
MFVLPLIYARSYVAEALYGDIPGAVFMNNSASGPLWVLECDQGVNATCLSGGVEFPIHSLDLNFNGFGLHDNNGVPICVGAFQPSSQVNQTRYDMVLGMSFSSMSPVRNAYIAINLGNMVNTANYTNDTAYIQLLPIKNASQAAQDFANIR